MTLLEWLEYVRPWLTLAGSIFSSIGVILTALQSIRNGKKIASVEIRIDGRLSQLLEAKEATRVSDVALATSEERNAGDKRTLDAVAEERGAGEARAVVVAEENSMAAPPA